MDQMISSPFDVRMDVDKLGWKIVVRFTLLFVLLSSMLFVPAGTFDFWQAWVYLAILFVPSGSLIAYLLKHDPELLERRMRMREKEPPQKMFVILGTLVYFIAFIIPGLDKRLGWSSVPLPTVLAAELLVLVGYALFVLVLRENRFASRVIEVQPDQQVISTGPYAVVRHPMYAAATLMYIAGPLALGSFYATIVALLMPFLLVLRIRNEEEVLTKNLKGYDEYLQKVKYRLVPGIW
jgi:protein-S-isoprenylcysteine O-methyltransferase Ste14